MNLDKGMEVLYQDFQQQHEFDDHSGDNSLFLNKYPKKMYACVCGAHYSLQAYNLNEENLLASKQ